jgi:hypothetical protein
MSQQIITQQGVFSGGSVAAINANFRALFGSTLTVGNVYYLNPAAGSDTSGTGSAAAPYQTLAVAYAACSAGKNDTVVLIGDGSTTATARVESAFTWSKNATHLLGICSPTLYSQRSRIAPTGSTTAFANFFTVSGNGCIFQNIQWFHGFDTGVAAEICMTVTGSRNVFQNCHFAGIGDTTGSASAASRCLKIGSSGSGENLFNDCVIGIDTVTRSAANASIEFASATTRNTFRRCHIPIMTSSATSLGILGTGNECCDRSQVFEDCIFENAIKSTSTAMTALGSFTTASPGGMVLFVRCATVGCTKLGDTNFLANSFVDMAAVSGSAGGLMVAPS